MGGRMGDVIQITVGVSELTQMIVCPCDGDRDKKKKGRDLSETVQVNLRSGEVKMVNVTPAVGSKKL